MTKWNLPEGRKPLTDADIAALTRRLADTAIEQSELYQAAKRDAEEAEAYASELEAKLRDMALDCLAAQGQATENFQMYVDANEARIDAEAKLAKAVEALAINPWSIGYVEWKKHVNDTLAELKK
jgi:nucleotide-binding universal stress UspA family protein